MRKGFTIVELLIVVVVIAILATVTIVAYNGVTRRANETSVKSDLRNTATKLNMTKTEQGTYPTSLNDSDKAESASNILTYSSDGTTFCLSGTTKAANGPLFYITHGGTIQDGACPSTNIAWKQIAPGKYRHSLGLSQSGKVYAWGGDGYGQIGNGATTGNVLRPTDISSNGALAGKTIIQVAAGHDTSFALSSDGIVYAWGYNHVGQLGIGNTDNQNVPVAVAGALAGKVVTQISTSALSAAALTSDGRVYTWGTNTRGELGDSTTVNKSVPTATVGGITSKNITQVSVGDYHMFALASDNTVYAWGYNANGQLGNGYTTTSPNPTPIVITPAFVGRTISQISAGGRHSLAIATDGTVFGWGANDSHQTGTDSGNPEEMSQMEINGVGALAGKTITKVTAAGSRSAALSSTGIVMGWGFNASGQIGDGTAITRSAAVPVVGLLSGKSIVSIGIGDGHAFAIDLDGRAYGWGYNSTGQLGDNTTDQRNSPILVLEP